MKNNFVKDINYCGICSVIGKCHKECYKNYCSICNHDFKSTGELKEHSDKYHEDKWCEKCNQIFKYIKNHVNNIH